MDRVVAQQLMFACFACGFALAPLAGRFQHGLVLAMMSLFLCAWYAVTGDVLASMCWASTFCLCMWRMWRTP